MVECNRVVCWDVAIVIVYSLKGIAGSLVVDKDLYVMIIGMDRSVVGCESYLEVKEIMDYVSVD